MKLKLAIIISVLIMIIHGSGAAQEIKHISGTVTTFRNIPLNNVKVTALKSKEITLTDSHGFFALRCREKDVLTVTASGFFTKKIRTNKQNRYTIDLIFNNSETGFNDAVKNGHIAKDVLQKAISLKPLQREKDYSKYTDIYDLIKNVIFNVKVDGTSVLTTKALSLYGSAQVLYVVDDMIMSDISFITPINVKTIEYIDGVDASSYGSRGANGIIKITLKK
jgi:hypothetical protein